MKRNTPGGLGRLTCEALRTDMALPIELLGEPRSPPRLLYARLPVDRGYTMRGDKKEERIKKRKHNLMVIRFEE